MGDKVNFFPAGDNGIILEVGTVISEEINEKIRGWVYYINSFKENFDEIVEIIPTYTTILIIYNPLKTTYSNFVDKLKGITNQLEDVKVPSAKIIHVPVVYGGEYGPDIINVAKHNQLTVEEVIKIHTSTQYLIYMIGFTPGFPYLGGMPKEIATPRLQAPRQKIPGGSVGIAGDQTGIYPIESPGGWQLIGRTPLQLFDSNRQPAVLFQAGDYIQFQVITSKEFLEIEEAIKTNRYQGKMSHWRGSV